MPIELLLCDSDEKSKETINRIFSRLKNKTEKIVVAFVTATLIDSPGHRLNSDDQIPLAR